MSSRPFAPSTPDDNGGPIFAGGILTALLATACGAFAFIQTWKTIREAPSHGAHGKPAYRIASYGVFLAGTIFVVLQALLVAAATRYGFGKATSLYGEIERGQVDGLVHGSDIMYICAVSSFRTSATLSLLYVNSEHWFQLVGWGITTSTAALFIAGLCMIAIGCDVNHAAHQIENQCAGIYNRWLAFELASLAMDVCAITLFSISVSHLQMQWRSKMKLSVLVALRLLITPAVALRLDAIHGLNTTSSPYFDRMRSQAFTFLVAVFFIVTLPIVLFGPQLRLLSVHYGFGETTWAAEATKIHHSDNHQDSIALQSLKRLSGRTRLHTQDDISKTEDERHLTGGAREIAVTQEFRVESSINESIGEDERPARSGFVAC